MDFNQKRKKKFNLHGAGRKTTALLTAMILIVGLSAGTTLAYLFMHTDSVKNTFLPTKVSCEVTEDFNGTTKKNVCIRNTGSASGYIRAVVVANWVGENDEVNAQSPVVGEDYSITYGKGWLKGNDGFWYYTDKVPVGESTTNLIDTCTVSRSPEGFHLSVEIVASAIQSEPENVVETEWNVTVENDQITAVNGN